MGRETWPHPTSLQCIMNEVLHEPVNAAIHPHMPITRNLCIAELLSIETMIGFQIRPTSFRALPIDCEMHEAVDKLLWRSQFGDLQDRGGKGLLNGKKGADRHRHAREAAETRSGLQSHRGLEGHRSSPPPSCHCGRNEGHMPGGDG